MAVETLRYEVERKDGAFEIRRYPGQIVAEVDVRGERAGAANAAFQPLFRFISGANGPRQEIAMTAPVTQAPVAGAKIAMTAPVTQAPAASGDAWTVRFVMPAQYAMADLPAPRDPNVRLTELPPSRVLAIRFSGFASAGAIERRTRELEAYAASQNLETRGPPTYAFYDAPFTPPFLRRNEIWLALAAEP